jgi:hypothetical protein
MEAVPGAGYALSDELLDEAYDALQSQPGALGAVAFADTALGTFGMRFDLDADTVADAVREGLKSFLRAVNSTSAGALPVKITRAEALLDLDPAPQAAAYALSVA